MYAVPSCLGLFGLVSFMAERRRKEIGIRKTLGTSESSVVGLQAWRAAMVDPAVVLQEE